MSRARAFRRLAALGLAAGLGALAACAPKAKQPPAELVFWQPWAPQVVEPLVRRFEAEHPGLRVRVERVDPASARDSIAVALASGNPPDLCALGSADMPGLLASGTLTDWSAGVADQRDSLRGWEMCTVGDAVYGLPWVLGTRALFWNKALFRRARLDSARAPDTWQDVRRAAAAVQRLGRGVHGYGVSANAHRRLFESFMPYAWGNGGDVLTAGRDTACFDSSANREALEFYLGLRKSGTIAMPDTLDREFVEGRLGLEVSGPWLCQTIAERAPDLRYGVALVPRPAADRGTHASYADGEVLVSFAASRRKAEALRLARFLGRTDNVLAVVGAVPLFEPAARGADTLAFYDGRPVRRTFARQLETAHFAPCLPAWDDMEAAIEDQIEQALFDRKPAEQAVTDANARLAELAGKR